MEFLKQFLAFMMVVLLAQGCVTNQSSEFWLTDKDLEEYRQRGGVEVTSSSGLYNGIMEMVPTNTWQTVSLRYAACKMDVPVGDVCDMPSHASLSLYIIRSHYPDARYAAQVIVRRKTRERYEEDIDREKRVASEFISEGRIDKQRAEFEEWRNIKFHSALEVDQSGLLYRRDIRCSQGDVIQIEGTVTKLTDRKTGKSLYPEMDAVIRRIISSVEPLNAVEQGQGST